MSNAESLPRILCVDDEPHLLAALERSLFDHYEVVTATSAGDALLALQHDAPFDVVISDMRMPGIDGAEFLSKVRSQHPHVMRILLTGQADTESAIAAVNRGAVFRFLTKPCPNSVLVETIDEALAQRRREQVERNLLETTLTQMVKLLSELLALAAPEASQRTSIVQSCVRHGLARLKWPDAWRYEMAAALSQIGCIGVPSTGDPKQERESAEAGWRLLSSIPRMETVAAMVRYQCAPPPDDAAQEVVQGAALLRAARTLERLGAQARKPDDGQRALQQLQPPLPEAIVTALSDFRGDWSGPRTEKINELQAGMVLDEDVRTRNGVLILSKGHELSEAAIVALKRLLITQVLGPTLQVRGRRT